MTSPALVISGPVSLPEDLERTAFNRDERFASRYLGVNPETLRGWRKRGIGPRYVKLNGRLVKYSVLSLISFVESQPMGGGQTQ
jgi:hypothetical protein